MISHWALPEADYWSTPFAQALLHHLDLFPGARVLDVAAGGGIPAFYIADQVGPEGEVLAVDIHHHQVLRSRSAQGARMPWLKFEVGDMRQLPPTLPQFDRITGNIAFMFFRPDRPAALKNLVQFLQPGGQIVLTFPSQGTFDSLWQRVRQEMEARNLKSEITALEEYLDERPSADHARQWLTGPGTVWGVWEGAGGSGLPKKRDDPEGRPLKSVNHGFTTRWLERKRLHSHLPPQQTTLN